MTAPASHQFNEPMILQNGPPPSENLLIRGLFRKPLSCLLTALALLAISVVRSLGCMLIGYSVKPSAWIDNPDAAVMGTYAGLALSPLTAIEVMLLLGQFEAVCNFAYYAKQTWLRSFMTDVKEQRDVDRTANLHADNKPAPATSSDKDPEYGGWLAMIPLGLVSVPFTCLFGCVAGAISGPLTKHDTARAALVRGAIGGVIFGGGCFICSIWIGLFLYSTQCRLPVFQSKALPDAEAGREGDIGTDATHQQSRMQFKNNRKSVAPLSAEGPERPPSFTSVDNTERASSLTQSKRESLRRYLGRDFTASTVEDDKSAADRSSASHSYAAALAAFTIGRQSNSHASRGFALGGTTIPQRASTISSKGTRDEVKGAQPAASQQEDAPPESAASMKTVMV